MIELCWIIVICTTFMFISISVMLLYYGWKYKFRYHCYQTLFFKEHNWYINYMQYDEPLVGIGYHGPDDRICLRCKKIERYIHNIGWL